MRTLVAFPLLLIIGCSVCAQESMRPQPIDACASGCTEAVITDDSELLALDGSIKHAKLLSEKYAYDNDLSRAMYWAGIALENGDESIRYNYAYFLFLSKDRRNLRRSLFHLRKAEAHGSIDASTLKAEVEAALQSLMQ